MNFSPITPLLGALNGPSVRRMVPEARMTAIRSLPPDIPTVHFLTPEYFLYLSKGTIYLCLMSYLAYFNI